MKAALIMKAKKTLKNKKKVTKKVTPQREDEIVKEVLSSTQEAFKKAGFTAETIAEELALIAFSDMADYVSIDDGGALQAIPFEEMKKGKSRVVKKVREKTTITENKDGSHIFKNSQVEYELHDKLGAIRDVIGVLGLKAPEKLEIKTDIAEQLAAARARVKGRK
jgi:hypothetical protein